MAKLSGGGIRSNKLVRPGIKSGRPSTNKINVRGVSQFGYSPGSIINKSGSYTTDNSALPVNAGTAAQVPMGNAVAASTVCGVGGSRTIYRAGTEAVHGSVVQGSPPGRRDILSEFGAEVSDKATLVRKR
jgi:hypothetical protein